MRVPALLLSTRRFECWRSPLPPGWLPGASRRALLGALLSVLLGLAAPAPAEVVDWLYQVRVPVADQSAAARREAAAAALRETLTRLSGLAELPPSDQLDRASSNPARYYSGFQYLRAAPDAPLEVQFDFVPASTLDLNKALALPVWWQNRPRVVPWISVAGQRLLLADDAQRAVAPAPAAEANPEPALDPLAELVAQLAEAMATRARQRGLPLTLPAADESGLPPLSPRQLERASTFELLAASAGLDAELLGQGQVEQRGSGLIAEVRFSVAKPDGGAELDGLSRRDDDPNRGRDADRSRSREFDDAGAGARAFADQSLTFALAAPEPASLGVQLIDAVADQLAARFAASGGGALAIRVHAVSTPGALVALLRYLNGLPFLDTVSVVESRRDELTLVLDSQAGLEQLLDLLGTDRRLVPQAEEADPTALFGPPIFDWQG